jgi:hypothetical protein
VSLADSNTYLLFVFFLLTNAKFLLFVSFVVTKRTQKGMLMWHLQCMIVLTMLYLVMLLLLLLR